MVPRNMLSLTFTFWLKPLSSPWSKRKCPALPTYLTTHLPSTWFFLSLWNKFICPFPIANTISCSTHHSSKLLGKISFRERNFQINVLCNSRISSVKEFYPFCSEKDLKKLHQMNVFSIKKWSSSSSDIKIYISRLF